MTKVYCKNCKWYSGWEGWIELEGRSYYGRRCKNGKNPDINYTPCRLYQRKWWKFWVK